jgi:hypothetical protein
MSARQIARQTGLGQPAHKQPILGPPSTTTDKTLLVFQRISSSATAAQAIGVRP